MFTGIQVYSMHCVIWCNMNMKSNVYIDIFEILVVVYLPTNTPTRIKCTYKHTLSLQTFMIVATSQLITLYASYMYLQVVAVNGI